jgi:hypothetical protein
MKYTFDNGAEYSIGGSGSNFDNEERSENKIVTQYDNRENKKKLEENWKHKE